MNQQSPGQPGPGWWQASDGNWYPPQTHPDAHPPQGAAHQRTGDGTSTVQYIPPIAPQSASAPPAGTTGFAQPATPPPHAQPAFVPAQQVYTQPQPAFPPHAPAFGAPPPYGGPPAYYGGPSGPTQNVNVHVKRGRGCFTTGFAVVGFLVVAVIVIAAMSGGGSDGAGGAGSSAAPVTMNLGQPAPSGPFEITVVSVQNPYKPTKEYGLDTPPDGKKYVAFELAVKNVSDEMQVVSTLFGAELSDSLGQNYSEAFTGTDLPDLSGEAGPGETRRGWVLFEVPSNATGLQLKLRGGMTAQRLVFNA